MEYISAVYIWFLGDKLCFWAVGRRTMFVGVVDGDDDTYAYTPNARARGKQLFVPLALFKKASILQQWGPASQNYNETNARVAQYRCSTNLSGFVKYSPAYCAAAILYRTYVHRHYYRVPYLSVYVYMYTYKLRHSSIGQPVCYIRLAPLPAMRVGSSDNDQLRENSRCANTRVSLRSKYNIYLLRSNGGGETYHYRF